MKSCPFCTGSIPDDVSKCQHCGEWIGPRPATPPPPGDGMRMLGEAAKTGVTFYIVMSVVGLVIGLVLFLVFWLPQWNKMDQRHQEFQKKFDADWEKSRQRQADFDKKFNQEWER